MSNPNNFKVYNNIPSVLLRNGLNDQGLKGLKVLTKEVAASSLNTGAVVNLFTLNPGDVIVSAVGLVNTAITSGATTPIYVGLKSGASTAPLAADAFLAQATATSFALNSKLADNATATVAVPVSVQLGTNYVNAVAPSMSGGVGSLTVYLLVLNQVNA